MKSQPGAPFRRITRLCAILLMILLILAVSGCDWLESLFGGGEVDFEWKMMWDEEGYAISDTSPTDVGECEAGSSVTISLRFSNEGDDTFKVNSASITNSSGNAFSMDSPFTGEVFSGDVKSYTIVFAPTTSDLSSCSATLSVSIEDQDTLNFVFNGTKTTGGGGDTIDPIVLAPPDWIQGTWSDASGFNIYTFSSDNVVATLMSTNTYDWKELNRAYVEDYQMADTGYFDYIYDSMTYCADLKSSGSVEQSYTFAQIDQTNLDYTVSGQSAIRLIWQY